MASDEIPAARWLTHLMHQLPAARRESDAAAVHELRTSIARLRVWLALGDNGHELDGELRWLRDASGEVRDLDVLLENEPPGSVALKLRSARERAQSDLRRALDNPRLSHLLDEMSTLPPVSVGMAEERARRLVRHAIKERHQAHRRWKNPLSVHKLRRALRDLRFSLEWLSREAEPLAKAQQKLAGVVDRAAALRHIDALADDKPYEKQLRRELHKKLRSARRVSSKKMAAILQQILAELKRSKP